MAIRTFNSVGGFSVGENPTTVVLANGDITTSNASLTGNVIANIVLTDSLRYANGTPWDFQQAAGSANYQIQFNSDNDFGANANFTFDPTQSLLTVVGNAAIGNITSTGNISATNFLGNFAGNISGNISGNIAIPGANTQVVFSDSGNANSSAGFTFDKTSNSVTIIGDLTSGNVTATNIGGTLTTEAQPNITSVGTLSSLLMSPTGGISGANTVSANFLIGTLTTALQPNITQVGTLGSLSVQANILAGNASLGNLASATYLGGTLVTGPQPNITSLGDIDNLLVSGNANVNGNINTPNLNVTNRVLSSLIPSIDVTLDLGDTGNKWKDVFLSNINIGTTYIRSTGNVITTDAANIENGLSTGSLVIRNDGTAQGNLTVAGNLTVSGNTTYINVTNLDISDPLISMGGAGNGANASSYDGKDRGLILHNYFSNGFSAVNQAFIWKTATSEFQAIAQVSNISGEIVTASSYANVRVSHIVGNLEGTITQGNQYLVTNVGVLANLVAGNLQVNTAANINSLTAGGLDYPTTDGSVGQVLATDGSGALYFTTISTSSLANGNSNVTVYPNADVTISSAGNANIFTVTGTGVNVEGTLNATGTLVAQGNATVANLLIGNSTIRSSTVTTTSIAANQAIATFSITGIRGAIFDIKGEEVSSGKYSIATVTAVHNGITVDYAVHGTVLLGGATGTLAVNLVSGNLYLGVTPSSTNSTVWTTQYRTI